MATVMARNGARVTILERQVNYRDHVRGEYMQPWGVAEAQSLKLCEEFESAGGFYPTRSVPYDELRPPEAAMAATRDMSTVLPGVPGPLCAGHPASCNALIQAAEAAGAQVVHGVDRVHVTPGSPPEVRFDLGGSEQRLECALVIGADGRTSSVRAQAGIPLQQAPPTHLVAGLLVDGVPAWPQDSYSIGTQDDVTSSSHRGASAFVCISAPRSISATGSPDPKAGPASWKRSERCPRCRQVRKLPTARRSVRAPR
jgi:2-polyprenyl-6-methoxyphenol hydroxylase-like FAD-dependent oxidoreductase